MRKSVFSILTAAAWGVACMTAQGQTRHSHELNLNIQEREPETCGDLRAEPRGGELAQAAESFTLARGQMATLQISATDHTNIRVIGAARADYGVEVCKFAVAADRGSAEQLLSGIQVQRAGRLSASNPSPVDGQWLSYFIVHSPKDAAVDLETQNGPMAVRDLGGQVKMRAVNGPIAVRDCTGHVEVTSENGPIAFEGAGGDIHLAAQNGPIAVKISGDFWNGDQLEARTANGPVSLKIADSFRSGVRIESGRSPLACKGAVCDKLSSDWQGGQRVIQMNGSQATIHISTGNGPVAIGSENRLAGIF